MSSRQTERSDCYICGRGHPDILETHHIVPQRYGGGGGENLVDLCPNCHAAIESLYDIDFYDELGVDSRSEYTKEQFNSYVYKDLIGRVDQSDKSNTDIINTALDLYFYILDAGGESEWE